MPPKVISSMVSLSSLLLALPLQAASLTGPGVSIELAQHRASTVRDVRYELSLDVTPLDSAIGRVAVRWVRSGTGDAIVDFRGRRLRSITVNDKPLSLSAFNGNHIVLPAV